MAYLSLVFRKAKKEENKLKIILNNLSQKYMMVD